jgi:transaldolase/glucose-6-phosphate isomerase
MLKANTVNPLHNRVESRIADFEKNEIVKKIFNHQPEVWTTDPEGQAEIIKRLGWLDAPTISRNIIPEIEALKTSLQTEGYEQILLLGMGGSSLAPEVFSITLGEERAGLKLTILDSTDPAQVIESAKVNPVHNTLFIVSSKSGTTSEVMAYLDYFWAKANEELGETANEHFVAITDPGTKLEQLSVERKFRKVFLADPNVGGRYSALTAFGLVPAGLMGFDLSLLLDHAADMAKNCHPDISVDQNPGLTLGVTLGEAALARMDKLTIITDPDFSAFGSWLEQLIAESSGKLGRGIVPVDIEPLIPVQTYSEDRVFIYVRSTGSHDQFIEELKAANFEVLIFPVTSAYDLASEFYRWEFATAVACAVLEVNAFDQPDVQDNKTRTKNKIQQFLEQKAFDEGQPVFENDEVAVFSNNFPELSSASNLHEIITKVLEQTIPGDYVAINAYLPRNQKTLDDLQAFRYYVLERSGKATTLGFGPRFLHSTGQLHKGGADNSLFIQLTMSPVEDLEIPQQGISFGALERAQALGDLEALQGRNKRAVRIHFKKLDIKSLY